MTKAKHKKTGKIYCTNSRDGIEVVIYTDGKNVFVREVAEFCDRFEEVKQDAK